MIPKTQRNTTGLVHERRHHRGLPFSRQAIFCYGPPFLSPNESARPKYTVSTRRFSPLPSAMIQRDVLMRQIRQFAKALAQLISKSHTEQPDEVLAAIDEACQTHLDGHAEDLRTLPPDTLLALCKEGTQFVPEAAQTLAQVLQRQGDAHEKRGEDADAGACFARSLLLYRRLLQEPDAPVSWKVGTTVAALQERVDALPVDEETKDALASMQE